MSKFIGRNGEKALLKTKFKGGDSEFIAIYGRRRVGKTSLIRHLIEEMGLNSIEVTGLRDGSMSDQLGIFSKAFTKAFDLPATLAPPRNWMEAFDMLTKAIAKQSSRKKFVIFLDELPWLTTQKSGLLQALDHFWNSEWVNDPKIKLVICGSAASWILDNIVNARGGLHNRLTATIRLEPFNLQETVEFLTSRSIKMKSMQILNLYLAMGGIPFYLKALEKGSSTVQLIDKICFTANGFLYHEFDRLFSSLFNNSDAYIEIIRAIAKQPQGVDLINFEKKLKLSSSGGTLTKRLTELEEAGFLMSFIPYGKQKKGSIIESLMNTLCFTLDGLIQW